MSKDDEKQRQQEGFLQAWSRRKRAAARSEAAPLEAEIDETETAAAGQADDVPELDAEDLAALPSIEEIDGNTDLGPFLKPGVPSALRKAALRKVWLNNALIAGHDDPAVDYAWDWNAPESVPGAGGVLNKESVAKMVKDLISHDRTDSAESHESELAETVHGTSISEDPDPSPTDDTIAMASNTKEALPLPDDPVRRDGQSLRTPARDNAHSDGVDESEAGASRSERAGAPTPRRHGSARPE